MLGYLYIHAIEYGQDFDEKDQDSVTKRMLEILALYVLGDKYDMPGLRKWCRTAFEKLEDKAQESCMSFLAPNLKHSPSALIIKGVLHAISYVAKY